MCVGPALVGNLVFFCNATLLELFLCTVDLKPIPSHFACER
jgi:hypothetical protein